MRIRAILDTMPSRHTTGRVLLTITEAATHARVSRRTIYNWLKTGKLETERTVSGCQRIYLDSLWLKRVDDIRGDHT